MPRIRTIEQADVAGKRVLCRCDLNVPLKDGEVSDDLRIRAVLPTVRYLLKHQARLVLMSHLGRPHGTGYEKDFSLAPVAACLSEFLGQEVEMASDICGPDAKAKVEKLEPGQVLLVENVRFDAREQKDDPEFTAELASLGDIFVNDAFGTAHRNHSSTAGLAEILPSYAGFLLEREVVTLKGMLEEPHRPFVAILGGSKVSDKIGVIESLMEKVDVILVGGGMCFTFFLAQGKNIGTSLREDEHIETARRILDMAQKAGVKLLLPVDVVVADRFAEDAKTQVVGVDEIPADMMGLDVGPATVELFKKEIAGAATIFWNGPMGVFEMKPFEAGTRGVAQALAVAPGETIIGGGDSVAAVRKFALDDEMTFISTGGGASMRLVEGKVLPGVAPLLED